MRTPYPSLFQGIENVFPIAGLVFTPIVGCLTCLWHCIPAASTNKRKGGRKGGREETASGFQESFIIFTGRNALSLILVWLWKDDIGSTRFFTPSNSRQDGPYQIQRTRHKYFWILHFALAQNVVHGLLGRHIECDLAIMRLVVVVVGQVLPQDGQRLLPRWCCGCRVRGAHHYVGWKGGNASLLQQFRGRGHGKRRWFAKITCAKIDVLEWTSSLRQNGKQFQGISFVAAIEH